MRMRIRMRTAGFMFLSLGFLLACSASRDSAIVERGNVKMVVPMSYLSEPRAWWARLSDVDASTTSVLIVVQEEEIRANLPALASDPVDSIVLVTIANTTEREQLRDEPSAAALLIAESRGIFSNHNASFDESLGYFRVVPADLTIY